jgi:glycosyltransferase A (GT-A) superfamily protein (DUF2064 family)
MMGLSVLTRDVHVLPFSGGPEHAFAAAWAYDAPVLFVGSSDVDPELLDRSAALLQRFDAVICPAADDGWWVFGVRDPGRAAALAAQPESLAGTGALTLAALRLGLRVAMAPALVATG